MAIYTMNAVQTKQPAPSSAPKFEATELVPQVPNHWPTIPGISGAVIFFVIGFVILAKVRRDVRAEDVKAALASRFSASTRVLAAIACLISGYHLCAWSLDERMLPLRVPVEKWWLVPVIAGFAVAASCGVDLVQRRFDAEQEST